MEYINSTKEEAGKNEERLIKKLEKENLIIEFEKLGYNQIEILNDYLLIKNNNVIIRLGVNDLTARKTIDGNMIRMNSTEAIIVNKIFNIVKKG